MRAGPILLSLAAAALAACQMTGFDAKAPPGKGLVADSIEVTALDALPPIDATALPDAAVVDAAAAEGPTEAVAEDGEAVPDTGAGSEVVVDSEFVVQPEAGAEPEPEALPEGEKSPEQLQCEAGAGLWTPAGGTGAFFCVLPTGDGGKTCQMEGDCEGQCLARSQTCAPYKPLFGCNEVLDKTGRRMMLCIN